MAKLIWKAFTGFINPWGSAFDSVSSYAMDMLNEMLGKIDPKNKANVQAALNVAIKVVSVLSSLSWLCPVKWQTAFKETIEAAESVVSALEDLNITDDEFKKVRSEFDDAVKAWKSPDDNTCVDCIQDSCPECSEKGVD